MYYLCSMLKEYRLTIFALLVFAVMIAFGISSAAKQRAKTEERIEIPLPLKDTSEQILYRNGYTVSYNRAIHINALIGHTYYIYIIPNEIQLMRMEWPATLLGIFIDAFG